MSARGNHAADTAPARAVTATAVQSRFDAAVGERRGVTDTRAAVACLSAAERELEVSQNEVRVLRKDCDSWARSLTDSDEMLMEAQAGLANTCDELWACECNLDRARYALVRATGTDALPDCGTATHHGEWTPGRPRQAACVPAATGRRVLPRAAERRAPWTPARGESSLAALRRRRTLPQSARAACHPSPLGHRPCRAPSGVVVGYRRDRARAARPERRAPLGSPRLVARERPATLAGGTRRRSHARPVPSPGISRGPGCPRLAARHPAVACPDS